MTKINPLTGLIAQKGWVLADGAIGTNLFQRGLETGYPPELWNVERPDDVLWLHNAFLEAGSDLILTNSFGGTSYRLKLHGSENRVTELNVAAAQLARQAADAQDRPVIVAGSMGPTGELFSPLGTLEMDAAVAAFSEQATALADGGADILWIETMSSVEEVEAAVEAAKGTGLPVCATMSFDTASRSMMGVQPEQFTQLAHQHGLTGFGANCGIGPAELLDAVIAFSGAVKCLDGDASEAGYIIAKGNCGIPAYVDGEIHYHGSPDLMAEYAIFARDAGATIIGGCCGTTPQHVQAMHEALTSAKKADLDTDKLKATLGEAWSNIPEAPQGAAAERRSSRRRRSR